MPPSPTFASMNLYQRARHLQTATNKEFLDCVPSSLPAFTFGITPQAVARHHLRSELRLLSSPELCTFLDNRGARLQDDPSLHCFSASPPHNRPFPTGDLWYFGPREPAEDSAVLYINKDTASSSRALAISIDIEVYGLSCSKLPTLPLVSPPRPQQTPLGYGYTADCVAYELPFPGLMTALDAFLYHRDTKRLQQYLICGSYPPPDLTPTRHDNFAQATFARFTAPEIIRQLRLIYAIHSNAFVLGVTGSGFWDTVVGSWDYVRGGL